jgi:hypothetical protein
MMVVMTMTMIVTTMETMTMTTLTLTTLEALLITANTLESVEVLLTRSDECDLRAAVRLARSQVTRMVEEETERPGTYEGLAD